MAEDFGFKKNDCTFSTRAIHVGNEPEKWKSLAVVPPISMATTFKQYNPGHPEVITFCFLEIDFQKICNLSIFTILKNNELYIFKFNKTALIL